MRFRTTSPREHRAGPAGQQPLSNLHGHCIGRAAIALFISRRDFGFISRIGVTRQAPPLLLVHGGLDHSRSWDHLAQALRADFHVVAPDLRGHGDSDWATGSSYSLADHVYDLTGLVKSAGFEKVTLVGHSMGGMVSLTYAGAFPEKVSRLVVLDGVTNFPARRSSPPTSGSPSGSAISTNSRNGKSTAIRRWPTAPSESCTQPAADARAGDASRDPRPEAECRRQLIAGSSIRTCAPARPIGCRSKTISGCGRASRVRRFWSAAARVFCPIPPRPA